MGNDSTVFFYSFLIVYLGTGILKASIEIGKDPLEISGWAAKPTLKNTSLYILLWFFAPFLMLTQPLNKDQKAVEILKVFTNLLSLCLFTFLFVSCFGLAKSISDLWILYLPLTGIFFYLVCILSPLLILPISYLGVFLASFVISDR